MLKKLKQHTHILHKAGVFLSIVCLVHCLAMPILIASLPVFAKGLISHNTEITLVFMGIVIAVFLFKKEYMLHRNILPFSLLGLATISNLIGLFLVSEYLETVFVITGSIFMMMGYFANWKLHSITCTNHTH